MNSFGLWQVRFDRTAAELHAVVVLGSSVQFAEQTISLCASAVGCARAACLRVQLQKPRRPRTEPRAAGAPHFSAATSWARCWRAAWPCWGARLPAGVDATAAGGHLLAACLAHRQLAAAAGQDAGSTPSVANLITRGRAQGW